MNRFFRVLWINRFVMGPSHYLLNRSDFGVEVAEIFAIENRLTDSIRLQWYTCEYYYLIYFFFAALLSRLYILFFYFLFTGITPHWKCSPHRCSSAKSPPRWPEGFEPWTLAAGRRANQWATPHPTNELRYTQLSYTTAKHQKINNLSYIRS